MKAITREQFIEYFSKDFVDIKDDNCPVWIPENGVEIKFKSQWFICVKPLDLSTRDIASNLTDTTVFWEKYWKWCKENLKGQAACYSSDGKRIEWWGFEKKEDILIWVLKWAR